MGDADVDKEKPGGVEVERPDDDIRGGARPADEDFAPTDELINFGGPGFSCWAPDFLSGKQDVIRGGLDP